MNVLLEHIEPLNKVKYILYAPTVVLEKIDQILAHYASIILNMPAFYALNYSDIFDGGLFLSEHKIIHILYNHSFMS